MIVPLRLCMSSRLRACVRGAKMARGRALTLRSLCLQLWISHDDAQIKRLGGRVLSIPEGDISPASDLDSAPPSKNTSSAQLLA